MGSTAVPEMIDSELAAFAELARGLTPEQWEQQSLCTEWNVRKVVEHVAYHTHRAGLRQLVVSSWEPRLVAENHADKIDGLVAWLASRAPDSARRSVINLCEVVIHQQDVRRPLQKPRHYPEATMRVCLDHCTKVLGNLLVIGAFRRRGRDVQLCATDLDWSYGRGPEVTGTAESLLMAIAGRGVALSDLSGAGVPLLAERIDAAASHASAA